MTELAHLHPRLTNIVKAIGFATSTWFRRKRAPSHELEIRRGPQPKPIQDEAVEIVLGMAWSNP
jgi:hypothetical protein